MESVKALLLALFICLGPAPRADAAPDREYQVKAVFLYNFAQFVEWSAKAFPDTSTPLIIGILGNDPFSTYLDEVVRGEKVNHRPIIVERYRRIEDVKTCHVLFVSASEDPKTDQILNALKSRNILTVGDSESFTKKGGMINFITRNGKIHFTVNLEAVKAADLNVSAKLLRLADIVEPGKG